ncbi:hypothetical protein EZS27_005529 [termite gut metagenome]|uniref:RagB/SusD family nutrient uptake outer membrane protein n=1 Tax=termite gut metagenome TaxID=433724 RepID=A0A5J4SLP4_9ZZZZ
MIRKKYLLLIYVSILGFGISSCNDFLDQMPSKTTSLVITTADQLDAILENYASYYQVASNENVMGHDDYGLTVKLYDARPASFTFYPIFYCSTWDTEYLPLETRASAWTTEYSKIFRANLVLNYLDKVSGSVEQKNQLKAEAHLLRAYSLLELAQIYCLPYTEETKGEVGLALKQSVSFEELSHRATLEETYALIESDIEESLKLTNHLVQNNKVRHWRGNLGAANSFAARYWLGRNNYEKAQSYAQKALDEYSYLLDYNTDMHYSTIQPTPTKIYTNPADPTFSEEYTVLFPYTHDNQVDMTDMLGWPEFYYFRLLYYGSWWYIPSDDLLSIYDHEYDLRYKYHVVEGYTYVSPASMNNPAYFGYGYVFFFKDRIPAGPTVAEMLLTKAECQARLNDISGAIATVNQLRAKRIDNTAPLSAVNLTASSREEAVKEILKERRREIPFYTRRFDIRRFNTNDDPFDDVDLSRVFYPYSNTAVHSGDAPIEYTLKKGDRKWASPIPNTEIITSQGKLKQNTY